MSVAARTPDATYSHTQHAPLGWILYLISAVLLVTAVFARHDPVGLSVTLSVGLLMALLGTSFSQLTIADLGDHLAITFGPLPLVHRSVRYSDIQAVESGRTSLLEGWGIHLSPRGGWIWNLWGRDCVIIRGQGFNLRLGTDDPEALAHFLRRRVVC